MFILFIEKDQKPTVINDPKSLPDFAWSRLRDSAVRMLHVHDNGRVDVVKDRYSAPELEAVDPIFEW